MKKILLALSAICLTQVVNAQTTTDTVVINQVSEDLGVKILYPEKEEVIIGFKGFTMSAVNEKNERVNVTVNDGKIDVDSVVSVTADKNTSTITIMRQKGGWVFKQTEYGGTGYLINASGKAVSIQKYIYLRKQELN
jgi:hypothetical protein